MNKLLCTMLCALPLLSSSASALEAQSAPVAATYEQSLGQRHQSHRGGHRGHSSHRGHSTKRVIHHHRGHRHHGPRYHRGHRHPHPPVRVYHPRPVRGLLWRLLFW